MRKTVKILILTLILGLCCFTGKISFYTYADTETATKIYLGGFPAGFDIYTKGAFVAGLSDVITENGALSPAKDAGLAVGDVILFIGDKEINNAQDIENALKSRKTDKITVIYSRNCVENTTEILPATDLSGNKRLGIFVRDNFSGIGTVTFIKGDRIATLGHPVLGEYGEIMQISGGNIYACDITGYIKGERGAAGELRGIFMKNELIGNIDRNCLYGVFGNVDGNFDEDNLTEIEIGDAKIGNAYIYTTINGNTPRKYEISIVKTDTLFSDTKNYVVKVTDKELLDATGGIVQGMSGSPIVQNGKLVGAVTHVFINDPTRGFGISVKNMINQ